MIDFLRMVRKIFGVLIGILGYLALITGASVITIAVIDSAARPEKWDGNVFLILAMASAILIGLSMTKAGQDIFESTEGQFEKDRGPGRWFYRGIFISFAAVFFWNLIYSFAQMEYHPEQADSIRMRSILISVIAGVGILMFIRNEVSAYRLRKAVNEKRYRHNLTGTRRFEGLCTGRSDYGISTLLNGRMCVGDPVIVTTPEGKEETDRITSVTVRGKERKAASDTQITITLEKHKELPKYASVSTTRTFADRESGEAENPYLNALMENFQKLLNDQDYMTYLITSLAKASFLVPAFDRKDEEGITHTAYPTVGSAMLKEKRVLPVFTDWDSLARYRTACRNPEMYAKVMTYEECLNLKEEHYESLVVNPFGKAAFYLSPQTIMNMRKLENELNDRDGQPEKAD